MISTPSAIQVVQPEHQRRLYSPMVTLWQISVLKNTCIPIPFQCLYFRLPLNENDSYISYLPLPHIYEHLGYWISVANGLKVGIYSGDVKKLKNDMQAL